jgi:hypothetical protein
MEDVISSVIYFHIATIGKYQEIFDEIYSEIIQSGLIDKVNLLNLSVVGGGELTVQPHSKIKIHKHLYVETGEFFTLNLIKTFSDSIDENCKILYVHTKGVTTPDNPCIDDWRQYMTYFNVNQYQKCFDTLEEYDSCGVDLVNEPTIHYSGNFWWANSSYIKKLPTIDEIKFPKTPPILSIRHNCEFWIGMGGGSLKSLWNSNINVYERHLHRYKILKYKKMKLIDILKEFNLDSDFLNEGYDKGGTDKNTCHSYIENVYEKEFKTYREKEIDLLEIGIETGGSLKLWKEYFLNSKSIIGVDISDEKIDKKYKDIAGVTMHFGDAYDEKFSENIGQFDIIIDDGPHTLESQLKSIELYLPKLKQNGLFVIEDVQNIEWFNSLIDKSEKVCQSMDNEIEYVVECIDLRDKKGRWDDLLFLIKS